MQQLLNQLGQQTFVGGKRVVTQELPRLPKQAATTVHRFKVSLHGSKPPVWRRCEIPEYQASAAISYRGGRVPPVTASRPAVPPAAAGNPHGRTAASRPGRSRRPRSPDP